MHAAQPESVAQQRRHWEQQRTLAALKRAAASLAPSQLLYWCCCLAAEKEPTNVLVAARHQPKSHVTRPGNQHSLNHSVLKNNHCFRIIKEVSFVHSWRQFLNVKSKCVKATLFEIFNFCPKIQLWFLEKMSIFFWVKISWKCCGFGLFSCWQHWFHEKNCQKKNLVEKLVKMLWFWTF